MEQNTLRCIFLFVFCLFFSIFALAHSSSRWKEQLPARAGGEEPEADGPTASRVAVRAAPCDFSPWGSLWKGRPAAESRGENNITYPLTWLTSSREQTGKRFSVKSHLPWPLPWTDTRMKKKKNETAAPGWFGSFRYIKIKKTLKRSSSNGLNINEVLVKWAKSNLAPYDLWTWLLKRPICAAPMA